MSAPTATAPFTGLSALLDDVRRDAAGIDVRPPSIETAVFGHDAGTAPRHGTALADGPAVAFPVTVAEVQQLVRLAARHGVSIVPRGAGTGLSGGATGAALGPDVAGREPLRLVRTHPGGA